MTKDQSTLNRTFPKAMASRVLLESYRDRGALMKPPREIHWMWGGSARPWTTLVQPDGAWRGYSPYTEPWTGTSALCQLVSDQTRPWPQQQIQRSDAAPPSPTEGPGQAREAPTTCVRFKVLSCFNEHSYKVHRLRYEPRCSIHTLKIDDSMIRPYTVLNADFW